MEVGKDRLCRHRGLCALLVAVCLCHTHFLVWVGAFLLIRNGFGVASGHVFSLPSVPSVQMESTDTYVKLRRTPSQGLTATCAFSYITLKPKYFQPAYFKKEPVGKSKNDTNSAQPPSVAAGTFGLIPDLYVGNNSL